MEVMVVLDKSLVDFHRDLAVENYALTAINMAYNLFHDASFGLLLNLAVVRIIRMEVEEEEFAMPAGRDPEDALNSFCDWQHRMNPGDDSHPNHHDVAVLITRTDICADDKKCGLLGMSKEAGCCNPSLQGVICEDRGLKLGFVIAHELAHTLGVAHDDGNSSGCNGSLRCGAATTVMNPDISMRVEQWSPCSQVSVRAFLQAGYGTCLEDPPSEHNFPVPDALPGVLYGADFQCRALLGTASSACDMGIVPACGCDQTPAPLCPQSCDSLNCAVPGMGCLQTHMAPAPGTHCAENRWCYRRRCLEAGERPAAVDGGWANWSAWSPCSRTCGSGVASSERQCTRPKPAHGGRFCVGARTRHRICSSEPCEAGQPSFRDVQCGEFNDWLYPEDNRTHHWRGFYVHDDDPCALFCRNENGVVASLRPKVVDGTTCYRGIRDICVGGLCREIPCDLDLESNAVEDVCGLCHGDGSECHMREGTKRVGQIDQGLKKVVDAPAGARNIRVEETEPTRAEMVVMSKDSRDCYIRGDTLGMFAVPGSKAWLGMIRNRQEALNIPGPVSEPISIMVRPKENVTLRYSLALPPRQHREPEFRWDFVDWSLCSARCGPGIQVSYPKCVEHEAGLVEEKFCHDLEKPNERSRTCDQGPCTSRWMIGEWQDCRPDEIGGADSCLRSRAVKCIRPAGEGEGEADIVDDSECAGSRPHDNEPCKGCRRQTRSDFAKPPGHLQYQQPWPLLQLLQPQQPQQPQPQPPTRAQPELHVGKFMRDDEPVEEIEMKLILNREALHGVPPGLPTPPHSVTAWPLPGKTALWFIQKLQEAARNCEADD